MIGKTSAPVLAAVLEYATKLNNTAKKPVELLDYLSRNPFPMRNLFSSHKGIYIYLSLQNFPSLFWIVGGCQRNVEQISSTSFITSPSTQKCRTNSTLVKRGTSPLSPHTIKKVNRFPIPNGDVANQTLPARE
jgi:hypothetical protein